MKLNNDFIMTEMEDEMVLVPVGAASDQFSGVARLNKTAAFLARTLQQDTDEEGLLAALTKKYEGTEEAFRESIRTTLDALRRIGALVE